MRSLGTNALTVNEVALPNIIYYRIQMGRMVCLQFLGISYAMFRFQ
jgi:hypothetical protein